LAPAIDIASQGRDTGGGVSRNGAAVAEFSEAHERDQGFSGDTDHLLLAIRTRFHPDKACRKVRDGVLAGVQIGDKLPGTLLADAALSDECRE
jgi:hypothetical protein